ncbi:DUF294 nucleotidyltransferase-like domain-containing protein [Paenibacillus sacheonensis]|uniref:CBS domain-containing protein n=1 Tax=Paenibacillus sacheonensis TaxID=742054 RepID=A0A7X5BX28_9BACL|nr:DUF294 nucleotidyltransferase-like domain-containing protein [Paenibacillus sacheonensis]MBM7563708.1 CBS domain-containing protein [Paenibacillus sacheonensis]NBC67936.1 hypothetical protein [Paenibacillus sacheonensis]
MSDPVRAELLARIGNTGDVAALRGLRDQIQAHMGPLLFERPIEQFYTDLNEVHDALIRRAVALSEEKLARMGEGSPPVPYAYLLFGSGGREEQTLTSDQDSGLVYADPEDPSQLEEVARYFGLFAQTVVMTLQQLGYPPCEGEVVSSNPLWCQSLSQWTGKLDLWFKEPDWERVRYLLIVADCRIVAGQPFVWLALKEHFFMLMLSTDRIAESMLNNTMRHKVLLGVFGQLFKEHYGEDAGSLDLKYGAYIPMVNAIRLLAIQAGIRATATMTRIEDLTRHGVLDEAEGAAYAEVFRLFMRLRLLTTSKLEDGFYTSGGKLSNARLTKELIEELKAGLRIVRKLQKKVRKRATGRI